LHLGDNRSAEGDQTLADDLGGEGDQRFVINPLKTNGFRR
jgi:hypothetical protein